MKLKSIFIYAIVIRVILMPLFYHPDIKSQNFHFQYLSSGVTNIYQFINQNKNSLPYTDTFNYLPLTYWYFGINQIVLKLILPLDFSIWINDWSANQNHYQNLPVFLFILKLPYLFFDIFTGYIILKLFGSKFTKIWLLNPFSIYLIYVLGNFDIVPVFLSVIAFYFLKKENHLSFFLLGLATSIKLYPLIFFPFFLFYRIQSIKKHFLNVFFFVLPIFFSLFLYIFDPTFISSFSGSGLSQKLLQFKILSIPLFPIIYTYVFVSFLKHRQITRSVFQLFLVFISIVDFHSQWLLWFLPFILPELNSKLKIILILLILIICILKIFLVDDNFLFWGHLIPIDWDFIYLRNPHQLVRYRFLLNPLILSSYLSTAIRLITIPLFLLK